MTITRIETGPRMSEIVIHGDTVYLAGQVGEGDSVTAQTKSALEEIERCAARDGNHASHLRKVFAGTRNVQSLVQESTRALRG